MEGQHPSHDYYLEVAWDLFSEFFEVRMQQGAIDAMKLDLNTGFRSAIALDAELLRRELNQLIEGVHTGMYVQQLEIEVEELQVRITIVHLN